MTIYFEFDEKRRHAGVNWPDGEGRIQVELKDDALANEFPPDLIFEVKNRSVTFDTEDIANKRLTRLQKIIARRLQEYANKI